MNSTYALERALLFNVRLQETTVALEKLLVEANNNLTRLHTTLGLTLEDSLEGETIALIGYVMRELRVTMNNMNAGIEGEI